MAVAVQADRMAGCDDLAGERGVAPHLLADQEEGRLHTRSSENLEHRRGSLRVRPVVEGERVTTPARRAVLDSQRPAQRRPDRRRRAREEHRPGADERHPEIARHRRMGERA